MQNKQKFFQFLRAARERSGLKLCGSQEKIFAFFTGLNKKYPLNLPAYFNIFKYFQVQELCFNYLSLQTHYQVLKAAKINQI
jgi:hypothetical protein